MVVPENEAVVRRFMGELWSDGDLGVADELEWSQGGCVVTALGIPRLAIRDRRHDEDGDRVVLRWTATGTHEGTFAEVAPTGHRVTWTGRDWFRLHSGQLTEASWSPMVGRCMSSSRLRRRDRGRTP